MAMARHAYSGYQNTLEALREFLQSMKRTLEQIHVGHAQAASQTLRHVSSNSAQSSYDLGMLSSPIKGLAQTTLSVVPDTVGKSDQMENWFFSQTAKSSQTSNKHEIAGQSTLNSSSSEMDIRNALDVFLEDMNKTIEAWSTRYHLLIEGKNPLMRDDLAVEASQPLESNVHAIDQLDFGPDTHHDFPAMEVLDLPNPENLQGSAQSQNGRSQKAQDSQGNKGRKVHFQGNQSRVHNTSFSLQDFDKVLGTQISLHDQNSHPQGLAGVQECAENDCRPDQGQVMTDHPGYNSVNSGNFGMDKVSRNDRQDMDGSVVVWTENASSKSKQKKRKSRKKSPATLANSQELTIRRFQYKVEVVKSPDWLPKGWVTELKTRSTGGSAGSKDKYYFDPVSNRRCRSQKEVFSLLETGKLGRYKRKTKPQSVEKSSTADISPVPATSDLAETSCSNKQEVFVERSSTLPNQVAQNSTAGSVTTPLTAAISPRAGQMGVVNNMFVPYRPGQPSDWLVYENLANAPRPVLENFRFSDPNASKPNVERGSTSWPWFLNNSESATRPFVERFEVGRAAVMGGREDVFGSGHFPGREPRFSELSVKRAKKPSKRAAIPS